jgi:hypothetical protein
MTRAEERLADALDAAARAVRDDTMRPLRVPEREAGRRAWAAPLAAAASLLLVVGLAAAVAVHARGPGRSGGSPATVPAHDRYYVVVGYGDRPVVRSTATGKITATVPVPRSPNAPGSGLVAAAPGGVFFVAAWVPQATGERIYRFRVTAAGRVSGFAAVPGGVLGGAGWSADAMAAAPGGNQVAIAFSFIGPTGSCGSAGQPSCPATWPSDYVVVLNAVTGKESVWRGGLSELGKWFSVGNLSWANDGHELVFFGQGCPKGRGLGPGSESCGTGRVAEARTLDPAAGGGRLDSGRLLLRQSARYPYIAQAVISPDGSTITAIVLAGPVTGNPSIRGSFPDHLAVEQISVRTGKLLGVLYRRKLGEPSLVMGVPDPLALIPDPAGQHWLLNVSICSNACTAGSSGWIDRGMLVPLAPADRMPGLEAW